MVSRPPLHVCITGTDGRLILSVLRICYSLIGTNVFDYSIFTLKINGFLFGTDLEIKWQVR